jgi:hypothetical protein
MAEKISVEVLISPEGEVKITTHGLRGQTCLEETESLEKAVGKVKSREKTREAYQTETTTQGTVKNR